MTGETAIIKLVVDNRWNKLLGVHMIANYASEIIYGAAMLIEKGNDDRRNQTAGVSAPDCGGSAS